MEAKDTEMGEQEKLTCSLIGKSPFEDVRDVIDEVCIHQYEISFKAGFDEGLRERSNDEQGYYMTGRKSGRKEVMEFKCDECSTPGFVHLIIPVKKLKEWGI